MPRSKPLVDYLAKFVDKHTGYYLTTTDGLDGIAETLVD